MGLLHSITKQTNNRKKTNFNFAAFFFDLYVFSDFEQTAISALLENLAHVTYLWSVFYSKNIIELVPFRKLVKRDSFFNMGFL